MSTEHERLPGNRAQQELALTALRATLANATQTTPPGANGVPALLHAGCTVVEVRIICAVRRWPGDLPPDLDAAYAALDDAAHAMQRALLVALAAEVNTEPFL